MHKKDRASNLKRTLQLLESEELLNELRKKVLDAIGDNELKADVEEQINGLERMIRNFSALFARLAIKDQRAAEAEHKAGSDA